MTRLVLHNNNLNLDQNLDHIIIELTINLIEYNVEKFQGEIEINKEIIESINNMYVSKKYLVFTRIDTTDTSNIKKCNFCDKSASYNDIEFKNYCWFHRTQYE